MGWTEAKSLDAAEQGQRDEAMKAVDGKLPDLSGLLLTRDHLGGEAWGVVKAQIAEFRPGVLIH